MDILEHCLTLRGKLYFAPEKPARPLDWYIVQSVPAGTGNYLGDPLRTIQIRRFVPATNRNSPKQQAARQRMKNAVALWHNLTEEEKNAWHSDARRLNISAFNAFVRAYLRTVQEAVFSSFDSGASVWDNNLSIWDMPHESLYDAGASAWDGGATKWDTVIY